MSAFHCDIHDRIEDSDYVGFHELTRGRACCTGAIENDEVELEDLVDDYDRENHPDYQGETMTLEQAYDRLTELTEICDYGSPSLAQLDERMTLEYDVRHSCTRCGTVGAGEEHSDARGIYIGRYCDKCWKEVAKGYRPEVLNNPGYSASEPIEEEW